MVITTSELIENSAKKYIGKTVYFFDEDKRPVKGVIEGHDDFSFFVGKRYGLIFGKSEFFLSLDEMFSWITEQINLQ